MIDYKSGMASGLADAGTVTRAHVEKAQPQRKKLQRQGRKHSHSCTQG